MWVDGGALVETGSTAGRTARVVVVGNAALRVVSVSSAEVTHSLRAPVASDISPHFSVLSHLGSAGSLLVFPGVTLLWALLCIFLMKGPRLRELVV